MHWLYQLRWWRNLCLWFQLVNPCLKYFWIIVKYKIQRSTSVKSTSSRNTHPGVITVKIILKHFHLRSPLKVVPNEIIYLQSWVGIISSKVINVHGSIRTCLIWTFFNNRWLLISININKLVNRVNDLLLISFNLRRFDNWLSHFFLISFS